MNESKTVPLAMLQLKPGETGSRSWQPPADVELVDVRLTNVEGSVDIDYVLIANMIQAAFRRTRRLARATDLVHVMVINVGRIGGQCGITIEYRELFA